MLWWDSLATTSYQPEYLDADKIDSEDELVWPDLTDDISNDDGTFSSLSKDYRSSYVSTQPHGEELLTNFGYLNINDEWYSHDNGPIDTTTHERVTVTSETASKIRDTAELVLESISWIKQYLPLGMEDNILSGEAYKTLVAECEQDFEDEYELHNSHPDEDLRDVGFDQEGAFADARISPAQFAQLAAGASQCERYTELKYDEIVGLSVSRIITVVHTNNV